MPTGPHKVLLVPLKPSSHLDSNDLHWHSCGFAISTDLMAGLTGPHNSSSSNLPFLVENLSARKFFA